MDNFIARSNDTMGCKTDKCQATSVYDTPTRGLGGPVNMYALDATQSIRPEQVNDLGLVTIHEMLKSSSGHQDREKFNIHEDNTNATPDSRRNYQRSMTKRMQNMPDEEIGSWKLLFPPPYRELLQFLQLV